MSEQKPEKFNLRELQLQLKQALSLIEQNNAAIYSAVEDVQGLGNTQSLLARCEQVVKQQAANSKPVLRIIHHFACSGGTLISKCIAAQPNVFLLSEQHPTTRLGFDPSKGVYTPRDIITQAMYANIPQVDTLAETLFVQNVIATEKHVREQGGYLVLRAHSHADYCTQNPLPDTDSLTRLLSPHFEIKHLVTVRNPIDSFLSLKRNKWLAFNPKSFDEYCKRLLIFINSFSGYKVLKYEDFVNDSHAMLAIILNELQLPYEAYSLGYIENFKISGDSGRSSHFISKRERVELESEYLQELVASKNFKNVCALFPEYEMFFDSKDGVIA